MGILLGILAIGLTLLHWYVYAKGRDHRLIMALAISFIALTLMVEYGQIGRWVADNDWSALQDVVPSMQKILWPATIIGLVLNILPAVIKPKRIPSDGK